MWRDPVQNQPLPKNTHKQDSNPLVAPCAVEASIALRQAQHCVGAKDKRTQAKKVHGVFHVVPPTKIHEIRKMKAKDNHKSQIDHDLEVCNYLRCSFPLHFFEDIVLWMTFIEYLNVTPHPLLPRHLCASHVNKSMIIPQNALIANPNMKPSVAPADPASSDRPLDPPSTPEPSRPLPLRDMLTLKANSEVGGCAAVQRSSCASCFV